MAAKMAPVQIRRRITLGVFLVGLTTLTILHQRVQGIPTIDALDPFGGPCRVEPGGRPPGTPTDPDVPN